MTAASEQPTDAEFAALNEALAECRGGTPAPDWQICRAAASHAMFGGNAGPCHLTAGHDGMHNTGTGTRWLLMIPEPEPTALRLMRAELAAANQRAETAEASLDHLAALVVRTKTKAAEATARATVALEAELEGVNVALRAAGIEYPLGARGVRDVAVQRDGQQERAEEAEAERDQLRAQLAAAGETTQFRLCQSPGGVLVDWTDVVAGFGRASFVGWDGSAGRIRLDFRTTPRSDATRATTAPEVPLAAPDASGGERVELEFETPAAGQTEARRRFAPWRIGAAADAARDNAGQDTTKETDA